MVVPWSGYELYLTPLVGAQLHNDYVVYDAFVLDPVAGLLASTTPLRVATTTTTMATTPGTSSRRVRGHQHQHGLEQLRVHRRPRAADRLRVPMTGLSSCHDTVDYHMVDNSGNDDELSSAASGAA